MLSPGLWHKHVPKDQADNLCFRIDLLEAVEHDRNLQHGLWELCSQDIILWIDTFAWQINPRHVGHEVGPFITWEYQERAALETIIRLYEEEDDMLWEKSREMGATWLAILIRVWLVLFHANKRSLFISHSEEAVTKAGDEGTLFAKVQFILDRLPTWMTGGRAKKGGKKGYHKWKKGFRMENGSNISASASTERAGVGDRCSDVLLDEFSKQRDAYAILGQTADTGPRLFIGTHYDVGGAYYDLTQRPDMRKIIFHWTQHPEKNPGLYRFNPVTQRIDVLDKTYQFPPDYQFVMDGTPSGGPFPGVRSPWYDKECRRRNNVRDVAMHLDINPQGSQSQVFDPLIIRLLVNTYCCKPAWEGELTYDRELGVPAAELALTPKDGGRIKCWFIPDDKGRPPKALYTIGVDPSTGMGASPSCVSVTNEETGEQVASYVNPFIYETDLAPFCVALCRTFVGPNGETARLIWEVPGPGLVFGRTVMDLQYFNVYYRTDEMKTIVRATNEMPGWNAGNRDAKRLLLEEFDRALRDRRCLVRDQATLEETLAFKYDVSGNPVHGGEYGGNDPSGARVNHGDRVISMALSWWLARGPNKQRHTQAIEKEPVIGSLAGRMRWHQQLVTSEWEN